MIGWAGLAPWEVVFSLSLSVSLSLSFSLSLASRWLPPVGCIALMLDPNGIALATVALCLGTYGDSRGVSVSYERGTPVSLSCLTLTVNLTLHPQPSTLNPKP